MSAVSSEAKRIFLAAVENHVPAEWPQFLDETVGDNEPLRLTIQRLLDAYRQANPLLDEQGLLASAACATFSEIASTEVGPFRLVRKIGRGAMGAVYLA